MIALLFQALRVHRALNTTCQKTWKRHVLWCPLEKRLEFGELLDWLLTLRAISVTPRSLFPKIDGSALRRTHRLIIRPCRSRSAAAYSRQTFPWTICRSVGPCVRVCVGLSSALWKNGGSDPDTVWHHRSDGFRGEAGSWVWGSVYGKGYFGGEFGARHCNQWGLYGVRVLQRRDAALFPNYFGQTCYYY